MSVNPEKIVKLFDIIYDFHPLHLIVLTADYEKIQDRINKDYKKCRFHKGMAFQKTIDKMYQSIVQFGKNEIKYNFEDTGNILRKIIKTISFITDGTTNKHGLSIWNIDASLSKKEVLKEAMNVIDWILAQP